MSRDTKISTVHGHLEKVQIQMKENIGIMVERYAHGIFAY